MNAIRLSLLIAACSLLAPGVALSDEGQQRQSSPLVQKIRQATAKYRDVNAALADGYAAGACVSGSAGGAMGVHFIKGALLFDGQVSATAPEALMYEPTADGRLRLVGVEFITFASEWPTPGVVPVLDGHLLHYAGAPNRYGIPAFYALHVWAWRENPNGTFSDWNPLVSCDALPAP